jgi:DNA-K related protein/Hsp70 protein
MVVRYLIGIDLGTTNSALAYIDLRTPSSRGIPEIQTFAVPQLVSPGETAARTLLPSFLYEPGAHDLPPGSTALPWNPTNKDVIGEFARVQGARVPGRLITSAKSWLCHAGVDRSAPLLPWSAPPDVPRISPVECSARYLRHFVDAWNSVMAADAPDDRLEKQTIVLTVPASFDEVARNLTVEAARQAGLEHVTLLEEPQAAFYCWLGSHSATEVAELEPGSRCLVIDVGGGTSDFSLIQAVEQQGELGFVRQAVGDHLLLGGDNMDLALAKLVESRLSGGGRLDAVQYGMLTQACRLSKETLLGPQPLASYTVTVVGRGRQVIGGAQHASLTAADVRQTLFEGFFPMAPANAEPRGGTKVGLHEMGLPYVSDPAITRQLAAFLRRHCPAEVGAGGSSAPLAILFNGGVFQPAALRERVLAVMRHWYDTPENRWQPLTLTNPSLDLAVAWGAARYAWLRHTGGRRIGGGIARSYYVAVEGPDMATEATAATHSRTTVLCVVPQRLEEGQEITLAKPELELALGQPVVFPLYTSTVRGQDRAGEVLAVRPDQLLQLPPLHTILRGGKRSGSKQVPVTLAARCTEIGTLELWCVAREGGNRWRLEFNVRDIVSPDGATASGDETSGRRDRPALADVWPEELVQEAARLIRATFEADEAEPRPRELTKALETALDAPRHHWPVALCRRLWEFLSEVVEHRRRSPAHLARWYYLAGYCLRPGFGDALDRFRVEQLWKVIQTPPRTSEPTGSVKPIIHGAPRLLEGGADYWIMWRRVAGGLSGQLQNALYERARSVLLPAKGKAVAKPGPNELAEMWRAVASLERLDVKQKELLGQTLLKSLRRSPTPTYGFWALTRLGARVLLYGPLNAVVHPEVVQKWLDAILSFEPVHESERVAWAFCLAQLARKSGQRALDIDDPHREHVVAVLKSLSVPDHWAGMVAEVLELESEEQNQMFGESLPIGLRLLTGER